MTSGSEAGPVTRSLAAPSSSTGVRSRAGVPAAPSTSDKILKALQDDSVRKEVARVAADDPSSLGSRLQAAVDDALTGDTV